MILLAVFIVLIFLFSLVSARLERTVVTAPMVFTAAGMGLFLLLGTVPAWEGDREVFRRVAEVGLVLLLFTDASRTDLRVLNDIRSLAARLLSAGMLLTILLGSLIALVLFRRLSIWEAGILGALLAPTDAGLGQVIVTSPRVPMQIRQALNVEAGLNDGLSVPFLLFFIALADAGGSAKDASLGRLVLEQLGYGLGLGGAIGLTGGWLLGLAHRREWITERFAQLGVIALPFLCGLAAETAAASMFIAAFVAGLTIQLGFPEAGRHSVEFAEEWGQFLNLLIFFVFGLLVVRAWPSFTVVHLLYAILSLTLVRMLPVGIALMGTGLSRTTVLFMGWFGPRGLASIVLGLVYLEHAEHSPGADTIRLAVMVTVLLSIFAHGLTAMPGMRRYGPTLTTLGSTVSERLDRGAGHARGPGRGGGRRGGEAQKG
jgi:sodium/hydrogen antiporter